MTEPIGETDLAASILAVYQGPFEEFISRRDALAKQLRSEKRRDDATLVKALRKPSRMAWVLDRVAVDNPESIDGLAAAITTAQTSNDLRSALEAVKDAVRAVAAAGARAAVRAEHPLEPNAIAAAVNAIIGDATAFADFRAGRLVDVPEAGGLDLLTALTLAPSTPPAPRKEPATPPSPKKVEPPKEDPRVALAATARAELRRAEQSVATARAQLDEATASVRDAEASVDAAERAVRHAQSELDTQRNALERAGRHVKSATTDLDKAEQTADKARARLAELE